jgi:integrase
MLNKVAEKMSEITDEQWNSINAENKRIVEEFIRESTQLSPKTIEQYLSALKIYFVWVKNNANDKNFWEIKPRDFLMYQNYLIRRGLSSSAVKLKRAAVSSLNGYILTYYEDEYKFFKNYITKKIAAPAQVFVHEKVPPTLAEYKMLCDELEKRELWQELAYLKFSFSTGCRRAEARQLLKEDTKAEPKIKEIEVRNEDGLIEKKISKSYFTSPLRCKGRGEAGKIRSLQYDDDALQSIKKWLEVRGEDNCPYVFVTKYKGEVKQVSENTFNTWNEKIFTPIIGRRIHPHIWRESRATTLNKEQGKDIKIIQRLLGHSSQETTAIYIISDDEDASDEAFTD